MNKSTLDQILYLGYMICRSVSDGDLLLRIPIPLVKFLVLLDIHNWYYNARASFPISWATYPAGQNCNIPSRICGEPQFNSHPWRARLVVHLYILLNWFIQVAQHDGEKFHVKKMSLRFDDMDRQPALPRFLLIIIIRTE